MAKDYKTIIKITDEEKNKIIDNSPKNLPLNPSAQGYSGAEIRKRLYQSTVGEDGSLLALLERLVDVLTTELNAIETDKADVSYADSGLSLKADKTYVDSKLGLKTDKTYVDTELDKKVDKTVYELAINDLENNKLSVITFNSEKNTMTVYVDTKANTAKSEAQSYADTKDASVLLEAKAYTDTKIADVEVGNDRTYIDAQDSTTLNQAKSYTDGKIDSLIANAPATYDTLKEIADYIASDQTFSQSILLEIAGLKTDKVAVSVYNSKIASIESNISNLQSGKVNVATYDTDKATLENAIKGTMKKEPANWSSDNTYKQGAVVWHNGSYYHAKQDVASGVLLTNSTYWENLNLYANRAGHVDTIEMEPQYERANLGGTITTGGEYRKMTFVQDVYFRRVNDTTSPDYGKSFIYDGRGKLASEQEVNSAFAELAELLSESSGSGSGSGGTPPEPPTPSSYNVTINTLMVEGFYDNFYYKVNDDATYTTISAPTNDLVIPNVSKIAFYYDNAYSHISPAYVLITGDYTITDGYYHLESPITINFYSSYECFVEGTKITLADKTYKNVEDITYEDELLVWDFDKGEFTTAKPIWIMKQKTALDYNKLVFSDGSVLKTVGQHRILNKEQGKFTYPMTNDTPLGTTTFNDKGEFISLVSKEVVKGKVNYYNIITDYHLNLFASTILTSCRLSNLYPIESMKYQKDNRELHKPEIFNEINPKWISRLRLLEQPLDINRDGAVKHDNTLVDYVKRLENTKI